MAMSRSEAQLLEEVPPTALRVISMVSSVSTAVALKVNVCCPPPDNGLVVMDQVVPAPPHTPQASANKQATLATSS